LSNGDLVELEILNPGYADELAQHRAGLGHNPFTERGDGRSLAWISIGS
jgi:hypothetical protein